MWLLFSTISYFFLAFSFVFDRLVLVGSPTSSRLYAFYVGFFVGAIGLILLPFIGFFIPSGKTLLIALFTGVVWMAFLIFLFESTFRVGISRTAPTVGGFSPIFTFLIGLVFVGQEVLLSLPGLAAFAMFIVGGVMLSKTEGRMSGEKSRFSPRVLAMLLVTAFFFSLYLVVLKFTFGHMTFFEGFAWTRIGSLLPVPFLLLFRDVRHHAFQGQNISRKSFVLPFVGAQIAGGLGVFFQQFSVFSASVREIAFIPALIGVQYIFLYSIMIGLYRWKPGLLKETMGGKTLYQKIFASVLVVAGLVILALSNGT